MRSQLEKIEHVDKKGAFYIHITTGAKLKGWCTESGMLPRTTEEGLTYIGDKPGCEVRGFNQLGLDGIVIQVTNFQGDLSLKEANKVNTLEGSNLKLILPSGHEKASLSVALFDENVQRPEPITEDLMITYNCGRKEKSGSFRVISKEHAQAWQQELCVALCDSLISSSITAKEKREYFKQLPTIHSLLLSYNQLAALEAKKDALENDVKEKETAIENLQASLEETHQAQLNAEGEYTAACEQIDTKCFQKVFGISYKN